MSNMHQSDGKITQIWSINRLYIVDKSLSAAQNTLLAQGLYALENMCKKIHLLYRETANETKVQNAYISQEIPNILEEICFFQGIASRLLLDDSPQGRAEPLSAYRARRERVAYVLRYLRAKDTKVNVNILKDREIRNKIVHVDERLFKILSHTSRPIVLDSAFTSRYVIQEAIQKKAIFCRVFIGKEEKILHLDSEFSVRSLWDEAQKIMQFVFMKEMKSLPEMRVPDDEGDIIQFT